MPRLSLLFSCETPPISIKLLMESPVAKAYRTLSRPPKRQGVSSKCFSSSLSDRSINIHSVSCKASDRRPASLYQTARLLIEVKVLGWSSLSLVLLAKHGEPSPCFLKNGDVLAHLHELSASYGAALACRLTYPDEVVIILYR